MKNKAKVAQLYYDLVERFVQLASRRSDIRGALIVGSRARVEPADEWADLDIVIFTSDPEYYLTKTDWIKSIGDYWLAFLEPTAAGNETECRVLFEGELDVDFAVFPLRTYEGLAMNDTLSREFMAQAVDTFERGVRIIVDKDKKLTQFLNKLPFIEKTQPHPPSQREFLQVINDFLYHAIWTAKHLMRGELWWAKMCSDCHMQHLLLQMIEWHAHATYGWNYDTWFRGRFLEKWADPRAIEGLHSAFAHYDVVDAGHALIEEVKLFRWISQETAEKLKYQYPIEADEHITEWIKTHFPRKKK
jgi:aminoglycoside 6-adenylyltransferase